MPGLRQKQLRWVEKDTRAAQKGLTIKCRPGVVFAPSTMGVGQGQWHGAEREKRSKHGIPHARGLASPMNPAGRSGSALPCSHCTCCSCSPHLGKAEAAACSQGSAGHRLRMRVSSLGMGISTSQVPEVGREPQEPPRCWGRKDGGEGLWEGGAGAEPASFGQGQTE